MQYTDGGDESGECIKGSQYDGRGSEGLRGGELEGVRDGHGGGRGVGLRGGLVVICVGGRRTGRSER